jgi:cell shape-determining protein MreC
MTYLSKNSKKDRSLVKALLIPIGILIVVIVLFFSFSHAIGSFVMAVGRPLWLTENSIADRFDTFTLNLSTKKELADDNSALRQQIETLRTELQTTQTIENENETLKAALNRSDTGTSTLAVLLTKPPFSPYDTCIVDIGRDHDVTLGNNVFVQGDVLVGKVTEVYTHTSQVTFFSSPGQKFDAIVGKNNVEGAAQGEGGGNFVMTLPKNAGIEKGDAVILPSLSTDVYGIVNDIENSPNDSFMQIYFRNPVNISELRFVEVEEK